MTSLTPTSSRRRGRRPRKDCSRPSWRRTADAIFSHDADGRIIDLEPDRRAILRSCRRRDHRPAVHRAVRRPPPRRHRGGVRDRSWRATASTTSRPRSCAADGMPVPISLSVCPVYDGTARPGRLAADRPRHHRAADRPGQPGRDRGPRARRARRWPTSAAGCGTCEPAPCSGATSSIASTASIRSSSTARSTPTSDRPRATTANGSAMAWPSRSSPGAPSTSEYRIVRPDDEVRWSTSGPNR